MQKYLEVKYISLKAVYQSYLKSPCRWKAKNQENLLILVNVNPGNPLGVWGCELSSSVSRISRWRQFEGKHKLSSFRISSLQLIGWSLLAPVCDLKTMVILSCIWLGNLKIMAFIICWWKISDSLVAAAVRSYMNVLIPINFWTNLMDDLYVFRNCYS